MKVALYARVSTDDKGQNPETQLLELRDFCQRAGWEIHKEYVDQAAAADFAHRTAWRELLQDAGRKHFDLLLVWRMDRAFRSVLDAATTLERLRTWTVGLRSYGEPWLDTTSPFGEALYYITVAYAGLERGILRERVKGGIARIRKQGKPWGRRKLGHSSQSICETIVNEGSVSLAAKRLECSVPYIYKMLQPLDINPARLAKGELKLSRALELIAAKERLKA
jgi:DNA invertase Pin-like site-specific DNA recombinase